MIASTLERTVKMKSPRYALPVLMIAALVCMLPGSARAQQGQPTKVALANPARIFNEIQETRDLKVALENKRKQLEATEFEKRQKLKDLQTLRDQLKPDAPQYAERNKDLFQASLEFEVWGRMQQLELQAEQKRQMISLYTKIKNAVAEVATAKGYDMVIAEQHPEFDQVNIDQLNVDQLRALINSDNVLYKAAHTDISADVIAAMDAKYKSGQ